MKRSEAREAAFLLLFEKSFTDEALDDVIAAAIESRDAAISAFGRSLVEGTLASVEGSDVLITEYARNWGKERLTRVSLTLLRMAVYEIEKGDDRTPPAVVINEAVELAKKYAGEEEAAFINGVLGGIARRNV